ncbi:hypothetical protein KR044_000712 [Drosophila immigrans]|nr:hypothetical protein KR044_000712 [Drosophila immigrans]
MTGKSDKEILANSMYEDDPNGNSAPTTLNQESGQPAAQEAATGGTTTIPTATSPRWGPQHKGAQELASLYSPGKRAQEIICVYTCIGLMLVNLALIVKHLRWERISVAFISALCGVITADFASGLVHWAADTWGSVDLPLIGRVSIIFVDLLIGNAYIVLEQNFLRPFREHHLDPTSITRHDFIETNGDNFMVGIPILGYLAHYFYVKSPCEIQQNFGWIAYIFLCSIFVTMTNQIHKWSHTYWGLPRWVLLLQSCHIILPRKHHRIHHVAPHETYFCITTGWLNWPLEKLRFWSTFEFIIERVTGLKPRDDDMKWAKKLT